MIFRVEIRYENHSYMPENIAVLIETNARLSESNVTLSKENLQLKANLEATEKKLAWLIEQVKLNKQRQFGRKAESSEYLQLELVFDEEVKTVTEVEEVEEKDTETITYSRKKSVGRKIDTSKLPREQIIYDLPETERHCDKCGSELEKFGEDRSERLEYIPAQLKVIEHICSKYTCCCCETVKTATKPEMPIAKCMAAPSLITDVVIKKFEHHLPWYRQSKIFIQEGIDIPANTIGNWFMRSGEVLEPLGNVLREQINNTRVLQADETTVKVLQNNIKGYMWCYHSCQSDNRFILFEYNDSRSGKVAADNLKDYQGILQTDGYSGYNLLREKIGVINIGCWAHCRRKFADVVKIASGTGKAHEVMKWIAKLYQIESFARDNKFNFVSRKELRQKQVPPILEKIKSLLTQSIAPPKSALGGAITYALNQWEYLVRYVDHGEVEIDNNWVENQIRPFALGRKNWLFIGNTTAAKTAALFYGLIQTCRLNNLDPRKYLIYVLGQVGNMRRGEVAACSLLPQFIDRKLLE